MQLKRVTVKDISQLKQEVIQTKLAANQVLDTVVGSDKPLRRVHWDTPNTGLTAGQTSMARE